MTRSAQIQPVAGSRTLSWFVMALVCMTLPQLAYAAQNTSKTSEDAQQPATQPLELGNVGDKSDRELTQLTAQWGQLSAAERRVLLAEVRTRMQLRQRNARRAPRVTVTRRYGRIVRKQDGSVVVQTQTETSRGQVTQGRVTFGVGFERRGARKGIGNAEQTSAPGTERNTCCQLRKIGNFCTNRY